MAGQRCAVAIVGGGPAGLTAALAFAKAAPHLVKDVVLLEKGVYPREKYCAGALGGRGDKILASLDARPDVPSVPIDALAFRAGGGERRVEVGGIGRVVRRIEFDHALAKIVAARGVRLIDGARVEEISRDGTVTSTKGAFTADIVIGADGVGGVVRKAMGHGAGVMRAQVLEVDTEPVPGDPDRRTLVFDASDRALPGYTWDFPTLVDGREMMCRGIYRLKQHGDARDDDAPGDENDVDIRARFAERLARMGLRLDDYKNKRFAERGYEPGLRLAKGNLMIAGEAAGIDPVSGEGIAQAIEYGKMAGEFVADVLTDRAVLSSWTDVVRRSRLGVDLRVRTRGVGVFYGGLRPEVESLLLREPSAIRAGCRHFAAQPQRSTDLARVALFASAWWMKGRARQLVQA